jgi:hypothetical protein
MKSNMEIINSDNLHVCKVPINLAKTAQKVAKVINSVPNIDGHFWVNRNGLTYDAYFEEYNVCKKFMGGVKEIRLPADDTTQTIMLTIHLKIIHQSYSSIKDFIKDYKLVNGDKPIYNMCIFNAIIEQEERGGDIIFGSYGWIRSDGSKFYNYGGDDYKGISDFLNKKKIV